MNPPFQIKICGITTPTDALLVCNSGADAIGINFYPPSPRSVDGDAAVEIAEAITGFNLANRHSVLKIGVFVNSPVDRILQLVKSCSLDSVQFHGDESPEIVNEVRQAMDEQGIKTQFIRAIRTQSPKSEFDREESEFNLVQREITAWSDVGCNAILLDAAAPGQYGGTGNVVDWELVSDFTCAIPLILAGGLGPLNVADAIRVSGVRAVDTASGVESSPGKKDPAKVQAFVEAAKAAIS